MVVLQSPKSEYEADDFSIFSEEDLAQIDAITSVYFGTPLSKGGPQVRVELETDRQDNHEINLSALDESQNGFKRPPIETHRRNHILSVTDLVSPLWCEVQFDYGLRQNRYKRLELRPDSFVSASGKEISVEKKVAVLNEVTKVQGKVIHKELEDELGLKEIKVNITTPEERWALRLLSLINGVQIILVQGYTRELPVFGILQDHIVVGVIDEVTRCVHPKNKRSNHDTNPGSYIDDLLLIQRTPKGRTTEKHTHTLIISDTKTRRTDSLPPNDDALSSRLQLMLYYRLLSGLLSEYPLFNFSSLWDRLGLDSSALFSTQFLVEAGLVTDGQQERMACLDDLVKCWHRIAQELDVVGIDPELQLVYRLQPNFLKPTGRRWRSMTRELKAEPTLLLSQEDRDLALAIDASLRDLEGHVADPSANNPIIPSEDTKTELDQEVARLQAELEITIDGMDEISNNGTTQPLKIVGTTEFLYDEALLEHHVAQVLEWWHGIRKPKGVPIHLSRRCFTCEYCTDCEWREEKALEFSREGRKSACDTPRPEHNDIG